MELCRKTILLLIFSSFMSVGWGQSEMDNYSQEIINIVDMGCNWYVDEFGKLLIFLYLQWL